MSEKMGFWAVFALVTGSQIGSGVFTMPAILAPYGLWSFAGWILAGGGALALALVFSKLCALFPRTGGPHVYIEETFGRTASFFTGWTYWVVSWVSSTTVIVASVGYLAPLFGGLSQEMRLFLEIALLLGITALNLRGVETAGKAEFVLTMLKFIPLLVIPLAGLFYFQAAHIQVSSAVETLPAATRVSQVTLLALWCFVGVECATATAGAVENPARTIPRAILWGTVCVVALYLLNSLGVMGLLPGSVLAGSQAPYVDAAQAAFGGNWHKVISLMGSLACIGTLNAWMLASGQIALGLAEDRFLPPIFARTNEHEAPRTALLVSAAGIIPLLFLTSQESLSQQVTAVIDVSVVAFLFIYLACTCACAKVLLKEKAWRDWAATGVALVFCLWGLASTPLETLGVSLCFVLSGLPLYGLWYRKQKGREP